MLSGVVVANLVDTLLGVVLLAIVVGVKVIRNQAPS